MVVEKHTGTSVAQFRDRAVVAINDIRIQDAVEGATALFRSGRERAWNELPDLEALRDQLKAIRTATLARLDEHLEHFERQATAAGAVVHWARDAGEACAIVVQLAQERGAALATKSKSMTTEEIGLNDALQAAGVAATETDLGEWIIQLAGEAPFHIVGPAIHKKRDEIAALFAAESGESVPAEVAALTAAARERLRRQFLAAGLGISGVNLGVAETGSIVLVTNEGNGRMVTSLPPVHIAVMGIEKLAPTWQDAAPWLALLARSATGQPLSVYTTIVTGPARADDADGPREVHIVLLDNGRSRLLGTAYEEALQCIRCGSCLNVCPVYREAGGHAYGSPYSGPIGAVISPLLFGQEAYAGLPQASTLCGACLEACPVRIDLPRMLLALRADTAGHLPVAERLAEHAAARVLGSRTGLQLARAALARLQRPLAKDGRLTLPTALHPAGDRSLPALAPRSFRQLWAEKGEDL